MSNKTIQLNPMFLSNSKATTPKKEKKEKPQTSLKPNKMKKQLLAKIKDFQNKSEKNEQGEEITITYDSDTDTDNDNDNDKEAFDADFANEFNKSLNFLSELSKQRKVKPKRNETLKKGKIEQEVHYKIETELPEEMKVQKPMPIQKPVQVQKSMPIQKPVQVQKPMPIQKPVQVQKPIQAKPAPAPIQQSVKENIKPAPLYSNLKNGTKPTFRQYHNKTQKNYGHEPALKPLIDIEENNIVLPPVKKPRFKKRITKTLKYSLGKHKNGKVSVLIKNAKTRRKVQTEQALLKQKSIADIKIYLRSKNLLKVGSDVPNDVLRQLYENAILAGDVTNKSKETLLHNYFNDK
uniref:Uncharacterized protein n=1 Tax=viral metagenome TaxID=1070528 RepID=A0A6C0IHL9_9ZZZZ